MKNSIKLLLTALVLSACAKQKDSSSDIVIDEMNLDCAMVYDQPGTYTLEQDLSSKTCGIMIKASDVTIDLNGHHIQGPNDLRLVNYGIVAVDKSNIKIKNGSIDGFGFGVALSSKNGVGNKVRGNEVTDMTISNSPLRGILIHGYNGRADSNKVSNSGGSLAYPDAYGFGIEMFGPDCMVSNNEVVDTYGSTSPGTYIGEGVAISFSFYNTNCVAENNTVYNNRAVTNKSTFGFWVDVYSVVTIRNNNVNNMHYSGIVPPRTTLLNNTTDIPMADGCYDRN